MSKITFLCDTDARQVCDPNEMLVGGAWKARPPESVVRAAGSEAQQPPFLEGEGAA